MQTLRECYKSILSKVLPKDPKKDDDYNQNKSWSMKSILGNCQFCPKKNQTKSIFDPKLSENDSSSNNRCARQNSTCGNTKENKIAGNTEKTKNELEYNNYSIELTYVADERNDFVSKIQDFDQNDKNTENDKCTKCRAFEEPDNHFIISKCNQCKFCKACCFDLFNEVLDDNIVKPIVCFCNKPFYYKGLENCVIREDLKSYLESIGKLRFEKSFDYIFLNLPWNWRVHMQSFHRQHLLRKSI